MSPDKPSSSPCAANDVPGALPVSGPEAVAGWRRRERDRLRAIRAAIDPESRRRRDANIAARLDRLLADRSDDVVAVYWPLKGEPDLRSWYSRTAAEGRQLALPVVVERDRPLEFRRWQTGDPLARDAMNIPAPLDGELVDPGVVVTAVLGYDAGRFRLGNGGGYYDRTLAVRRSRPLLVGVGYPQCELRTIYPQPHDVPMDYMVTDTGISPEPR